MLFLTIKLNVFFPIRISLKGVEGKRASYHSFFRLTRISLKGVEGFKAVNSFYGIPCTRISLKGVEGVAPRPRIKPRTIWYTRISLKGVEGTSLPKKVVAP